MASALKFLARNPITVSAKITGHKEILKKLEALGKREAQKIVRRALLQGAGVIRDKARELAPVRTTSLKRAIIAQTNRDRGNRDVISASVGIGYTKYRFNAKGKLKRAGKLSKRASRELGAIRPRNYAHLVEFGHHIRRKPKGPSVGTVPAKPFLRPAFDTTQAEVLQTITDRLNLEIDKVAKGS